MAARRRCIIPFYNKLSLKNILWDLYDFLGVYFVTEDLKRVDEYRKFAMFAIQIWRKQWVMCGGIRCGKRNLSFRERTISRLLLLIFLFHVVAHSSLTIKALSIYFLSLRGRRGLNGSASQPLPPSSSTTPLVRTAEIRIARGRIDV